MCCAVQHLARSRAVTFLNLQSCCVLCSYTALLREAFNPAGAGRGLFFSFDADVTLTQQQCVCAALTELTA
jgi:hypothetical protein